MRAYRRVQYLLKQREEARRRGDQRGEQHLTRELKLLSPGC